MVRSPAEALAKAGVSNHGAAPSFETGAFGAPQSGSMFERVAAIFDALGEQIMKSYAYRALFEPGDRRGNVVVTFPDVPEAVTQGRGKADARAMAEESLGLVLLTYLERGMPLPKPRARSRGLVEIMVAPEVAAKLAVIEAFQAASITKSELVRRIGKDEKEVRRILDPKHATKLPALTAALRALGKRLVVGVTKAEAA